MKNFLVRLQSASVVSSGTVALLSFANIGVISGTNFHVSQNDIFLLSEIAEVVSQQGRA